jgi:L-alanine-DL-glutamate epimerase-like enolase superfamily enzyme
MSDLRLDIRTESFPLAEVFTIARGSKTKADVIYVEITRKGITGRGESVPYSRYNETIDSVKAQIASLPEKFDRISLQDLLPPGAARNAVDCALWDLEAKSKNKRVWQLAGLPKPGPEITAFTLSLNTPDRMKAAAARHAHRPLLKIKLGTPDDMPRLEAVRSGAPQRFIKTSPLIFCVLALRWSNSPFPPTKMNFLQRLSVRFRFARMNPAMIGRVLPH